jgi:hypothetical protein
VADTASLPPQASQGMQSIAFPSRCPGNLAAMTESRPSNLQKAVPCARKETPPACPTPARPAFQGQWPQELQERSEPSHSSLTCLQVDSLDTVPEQGETSLAQPQPLGHSLHRQGRWPSELHTTGHTSLPHPGPTVSVRCTGSPHPQDIRPRLKQRPHTHLPCGDERQTLRI